MTDARGSVRLVEGTLDARALDGPSDFRFAAERGEIRVRPVEHASFVLEAQGLVIYNDPVGGAALYAGLPAADLILLTHEHSDHFDLETLVTLVGEETKLITNPAAFAELPADLQARATALANDEIATVDGVSIETVPAYNTTADRLQYHPQGRGNGYLLEFGMLGLRVYIAGDTEDVPEMRRLIDIDVAFLPMNLPYTMTVEQAAAAVAAFAPGFVLPYHYKESDLDAFVRLVADSGAPTEVVLGRWYG